MVGVRVVKAFGQEERETAALPRRSERIFDANVKARAPRGRVPAAAGVPAGAGGRRPCSVGGWMVVAAASRSATSSRFNLLLGMLILPLRMLGMWVGQAQRAVASGSRVLELST